MTHCCDKREESGGHHENAQIRPIAIEQKGKAGLKEYVIIGMLIALIVFASVTALKINALSANSNGNANSNSQGETYEQMMARMHPGQAPAKSSGSGSQMVGGC